MKVINSKIQSFRYFKCFFMKIFDDEGWTHREHMLNSDNGRWIRRYLYSLHLHFLKSQYNENQIPIFFTIPCLARGFLRVWIWMKLTSILWHFQVKSKILSSTWFFPKNFTWWYHKLMLDSDSATSKPPV